MPDEKQFLTDIQSTSADVRFTAWRSAGEVSPSVIPELAKLAASKDPGLVKAAIEALTTMTHARGKEVVKGLLEIATPGVRVHALRLLSLVGQEEHVPEIAKSIHDPQLREEVVFCVERIPGGASDKALMTAYKDAKDDFKPRILAALGHRRTAAAANLCAEASRSANQEIALAGVKAFGRIGKKASTTPKPLEMDSMLRYADAQAKEGNTAEAMQIYKTALAAPEPHLQCAGIIGLSKVGTPEAATAIMPKLKSDNRTVRITAVNAWRKIAG
jgi:HEAT repeat protein